MVRLTTPSVHVDLDSGHKHVTHHVRGGMVLPGSLRAPHVQHSRLSSILRAASRLITARVALL